MKTQSADLVLAFDRCCAIEIYSFLSVYVNVVVGGNVLRLTFISLGFSCAGGGRRNLRKLHLWAACLGEGSAIFNLPPSLVHRVDCIY